MRHGAAAVTTRRHGALGRLDRPGATRRAGGCQNARLETPTAKDTVFGRTAAVAAGPVGPMRAHASMPAPVRTRSFCSSARQSSCAAYLRVRGRAHALTRMHARMHTQCVRRVCVTCVPAIARLLMHVGVSSSLGLRVHAGARAHALASRKGGVLLVQLCAQRVHVLVQVVHLSGTTRRAQHAICLVRRASATHSHTHTHTSSNTHTHTHTQTRLRRVAGQLAQLDLERLAPRDRRVALQPPLQQPTLQPSRDRPPRAAGATSAVARCTLRVP